MEAKKKFGTFDGVFVPSFETIIGTVVFLLLPMLSAQVGLIWMLVILILGHTVTFSTTASLSDCVTNLNRIGGGGLYAICKESMGKALGGAIGISLFLAQVASIGFYLIGFTDTLFPLIQGFWTALLPESLVPYSRQLLTSTFLLLFCIIVLTGADFVVKLQTVIFIILGVSLLTLFVAPFLGMKSPTGDLPLYILTPNWWGNSPMSIGLFFICFTQFFPAVTGISAGVGMSGDLRTPQRSIVTGTFAAVVITFVIYLLVTVSYSFLNPVLFQGNSPLLTELFGIGQPFPRQALALMVFVGILVATASSGLSLFVTGPRTLQSIIYDRILPRKLSFLAWDFRQGGSEPRWAILFSFVMALVVVWAGDLRFAATLVGILFLLVYAWVNGSAFLERISHSPTFRPSFQGHWAYSLYGVFASLVVIALYSWILGLALVLSQMLIFHLLLRYKTTGALEGVWWGLLFNVVNRATQKLRQEKENTHKNWRPIVQAIAVDDGSSDVELKQPWQDMVSFAQQIAEFGGFVEFHLLCKEKNLAKDPKENPEQENYNIPLLHRIHRYSKKASDLGPQIVRHSGLVIEPNTLLLEAHSELDILQMLRQARDKSWHSILYRPARNKKNQVIGESIGKTIDVWWYNESNGNFMLILAYMINQHFRLQGEPELPLRLFHYLNDNDEMEQRKQELAEYLQKSRLDGEVIVLPQNKDKTFIDMMGAYSVSASHIFTGLPGSHTENNSSRRRFWDFDDFFFERMIKNFSPGVSIYFVKCAGDFELIAE